jgi:hypothetical protein
MLAWGIVLTWTVDAGFAALLADRRGRSAGWFAVAGFVLGPIGLIWAAFALPAGEMSRAERRRADEIKQAHANAEHQRRLSGLHRSD